MTISSTRYVIDGLTLPVLQGGDIHSTEAIVFIHGFPGSANDWKPFLNSLSPFHRVVALNMPGFGDADKPSSFNYTVESYQPILSALFDEMGIQNIHFVLHDFAGAWGLTWASNNIERMLSFTLMDTGLFLEKWHSLAKLYRTPILGDLFSFLSPAQRAFNSTIQCKGANRLSTAQLIELRKQMDYGSRRAMKRLYRATEVADERHSSIAALFENRDFPAMIIWGEDDPYLPVSLAKKQLDAFPNASVHILTECGHWPLFEQQDAVNALLVAFYRKYAAEGNGPAVNRHLNENVNKNLYKSEAMNG